ncbi:B-cell receptor CD22 [Genypterus blacodes]|uniref:B-cell receptor CD22 n=1 Tax=Genypterus blacodes TaxID=154954 RepID=UPI003F760FEF
MDAWTLVLLCLSSSVLHVEASSWTANVPSSVKGLLGSCVFIPCSYNYPDPGRTLTGFTGIWRERTNHIVYHPVESHVMPQYRNRTKLVGDLRHKNCSLSIQPLSASDTGPFHFRIEIADYDNFSFAAKAVSLTVLKAPDPISLSAKDEVVEGASVSASCTASHFCPTAPLAFSWSHPGKQHVQSKQLTDGQWRTTSSLTFHPTHADHNKTLACSVTYPGGQHKTRSKLLKVKYAPMNVKVAYRSTVKEGETVQLTCSSNANPTAHSYEWRDARGALLFRGHAYSIFNVSRHKDELYCTAFNTEGEGESSLVQLHVLYPPEIKHGSACSSAGDTVSCVCIVESEPASTVQFVLPDRLLSSSEVETHGCVTVGILQGEFGHSGFVDCVANNTQGHSKLTLSIPANSTTQISYVAVSIGAFVTVVIVLIVLGAIRKCRGSSVNQPSMIQMRDEAKTLEPPHHSTPSRKAATGRDEDKFSNAYANTDNVYGNVQDVWAADEDDDDAVYANV